MNYQHNDLAHGRWQNLTIPEQMANIGSEIERTLKWREKNKQISKNAFIRCLELIDLSLAYPRTYSVLKEFARMRELLVDFFLGKNEYHSTQPSLQKYFYSYTVYAQKLRNPPSPAKRNVAAEGR